MANGETNVFDLSSVPSTSSAMSPWYFSILLLKPSQLCVSNGLNAICAFLKSAHRCALYSYTCCKVCCPSHKSVCALQDVCHSTRLSCASIPSQRTCRRQSPSSPSSHRSLADNLSPVRWMDRSLRSPPQRIEQIACCSCRKA